VSKKPSKRTCGCCAATMTPSRRFAAGWASIASSSTSTWPGARCHRVTISDGYAISSASRKARYFCRRADSWKSSTCGRSGAPRTTRCRFTSAARAPAPSQRQSARYLSRILLQIFLFLRISRAHRQIAARHLPQGRSVLFQEHRLPVGPEGGQRNVVHFKYQGLPLLINDRIFIFEYESSSRTCCPGPSSTPPTATGSIF
jgi:hypothetical protein